MKLLHLAFFLYLIFSNNLFAADLNTSSAEMSTTSESWKSTFRGLFQGWAFNSPSSDQNLRFKKGKIWFIEETGGPARAVVSVDFAKLVPAPNQTTPIKPISIISDLRLQYQIHKNFELTLGQMQTPMSDEYISPEKNGLLPDLSLVGRNFGLKELGVRLKFQSNRWRNLLMYSTGKNVANYDENPKSLSSAYFINHTDYYLTDQFSLGGFISNQNKKYGLNTYYHPNNFALRIEVARSDFQQGLTSEISSAFWGDTFIPVLRLEYFEGLGKIKKKTITQVGKAITTGLNYKWNEQDIKFQLAGTLSNGLSAPDGTLALQNTGENFLLLSAIQYAF